MKIIDLLNKIANGEKVPKRIIYDQFVYVWNSKIENYQREVDEITTLNWDYITINCLNEPVEILDKLEEKKIPEKLDDFDIQGLEVSGYSMTQAEYLLEDGVKENREMINWILDYLKSKGE